MYRFDAGHGSLVVEQTIATSRTEIGFAMRAVDGRAIGRSAPEAAEVTAGKRCVMLR